jgi:uncharacterized protein
MTLAETRPRPRPDRAPPRRPVGDPDDRRGAVGRTIVVAVAALALAALLDAEALQDTASSQPFGWRRDVAVALVDPVLDVSRTLHLTAPRRWLEDAFDRPHTRPDPPPIAAPTSTVPESLPSTSDPPSTSPSTSPSTAPSTSTPPTTTTTAEERRTPTESAPLRLLIAGDSMTEATGPALLDIADGLGVVDGAHELRYSSGLTRPDYFDWPAMLAALVEQHDPEAIVVMFGANDAQGIQTPAGAADFGAEAWIAEYRSRVAATMSLLDGDGRTVYWIGQPVMRSGDFDARMHLVSDIYRSEAERHDHVRFIDTRALFADESGAYSAYLPDANGQPVLVRREDGIHLTSAGADRLAQVVMAAIGEEWELDGGSA